MHGRDDEDLLADLIDGLKRPLPGHDAQAKMSPRPPRGKPLARQAPADARLAAALILLYPNGASERRTATTLSLALTVRRADLSAHAGQISLPGGRIEPGESAQDAALREAAEEVGVDTSQVRVLGALTPLYVMVSRFLVTPFVAITDTRPQFQLDPREVAELIEVPVATLLDPAVLQWGHRTREGYLIDFPYFDLGGHQVWGATAMILSEFLTIVDGGFAPNGPPR